MNNPILNKLDKRLDFEIYINIFTGTYCCAVWYNTAIPHQTYYALFDEKPTIKPQNVEIGQAV